MFDNVGRTATMSIRDRRQYIHDWVHDGPFRAARDYSRENALDNDKFNDVLAVYETTADLEIVGYLIAAVAVVSVPIVAAVKVVKRFKRK